MLIILNASKLYDRQLKCMYSIHTYTKGLKENIKQRDTSVSRIQYLSYVYRVVKLFSLTVWLQHM